MLVYGDLETVEDAAAVGAGLRRDLAALEGLPAGLERHAALVAAFIRAGQLVQAVADREFAERGLDASSPNQQTGSALLLDLAGAVHRSSRSGFSGGKIGPAAASLLDRLDLRDAVPMRLAEGFAHYALYPETYLLAAAASGLPPTTRVIGIRSIGTGLAALVAAALGGASAVTVRPVGHPFARRIDAAPELTASLVADAAAPFAIVDEGPGLSGSSFIAVARWLEEAGVPAERIHFFPSHAGSPGGAGGPETLERWRRHPRHHVSFEAAVLEPSDPVHRLGGWVAGLVGRLDAPLQDISGGGWRALQVGGDEVPPADARLERRKFLATAGGERWLVKFAGLGEIGFRKLREARLLASAGLSPEVAGLVHGFIVQRWADGLPLSPAFPRRQLLDGLACYLAFRLRNIPASNSGASLSELARMAAHNAGEALGHRAGERLAGLLGPADGLETRVRRAGTDNRLHAWEWLAAEGGRLLKTDALDHSAGHDLVGCQDIAWDIAGAIVEHDLTGEEGKRFAAAVEEISGQPADPDLLRFLLPCYLAFQLGLWTIAAENNGETEAPRLRAAAGRYADRLRQWLALAAPVS